MEQDRGTAPFWLDIERPGFGTLEQPIRADVAIIGAGIVGLKLARVLARHGARVAILEGARVGEGASGRNQGTINRGPSPGYGALVRRHGRGTARRLWQLGDENHRLIRGQIAEYAIACDYQRDGMISLVRSDLPEWQAHAAACRAEYELLREDGFAVSWLDDQAVGQITAAPAGTYACGMIDHSDGQFHSGRYVIGLAQGIARIPGVALFEGVRVRAVRRSAGVTRLDTDRHPVDAPLVVLGTNALVPQVVPGLERSMRAERGQVIVTAPLATRPCRGSFGTSLAWWREIDDGGGRWRLLFGGGRERDEPDSLFPQFDAQGGPHQALERDGFAASAAHQRRLDLQLATLFPELAGVPITHRWGGLQSFTADGLPLVGCLDADRQIYGVVALCGRGNCHSDVAAEHLGARLCGVDGPAYADLFDDLCAPDRASARWPAWRSAYSQAPVGDDGRARP